MTSARLDPRGLLPGTRTRSNGRPADGSAARQLRPFELPVTAPRQVCEAALLLPGADANGSARRSSGGRVLTSRLMGRRVERRIEASRGTVCYRWIRGPLPYTEETVEFRTLDGGGTSVRWSGRVDPARGLFQVIVGPVVRAALRRDAKRRLDAMRRLAEVVAATVPGARRVRATSQPEVGIAAASAFPRAADRRGA